MIVILGNSNIIDAGAYTVEVVDSNHCSAVSNPFYFGVSDVISNNPSLARIYPNPASKYINIDNIQNIESIDIFSLNGTIVKKYSYGELKDQLSLTGIQKWYLYYNFKLFRWY